MSHTYHIGGSKYVCINTESEKNPLIEIGVKGSDCEFITFNSIQWTRFLLMNSEIDEALELCFWEYARRKHHIATDLFITYSTDFQSIAIRRYFYDFASKTILPTKFGITICIREWKQLNESIRCLQRDFQILRMVVQCNLKLFHPRLLCTLNCHTCSELITKGFLRPQSEIVSDEYENSLQVFLEADEKCNQLLSSARHDIQLSRQQQSENIRLVTLNKYFIESSIESFFFH